LASPPNKRITAAHKNLSVQGNLSSEKPAGCNKDNNDVQRVRIKRFALIGDCCMPAAAAGVLKDEAVRLPQPPRGINAMRIAMLSNAPKKDVEAAYRVLERAVTGPNARMSEVLWPAEMVLDGAVGNADADRVLAVLDRTATLPGDDADRVNLLVARFKAYANKRDFAAAATVAGQLALAPGDDPGRLLEVAWTIVRREDADGASLAAARELAARAAAMRLQPDAATDLGRVRVGLALRAANPAAVDEAVRQLTRSHEATPGPLRPAARHPRPLSYGTGRQNRADDFGQGFPGRASAHRGRVGRGGGPRGRDRRVPPRPHPPAT
jgi:hypothetical protein